MLYVRNAKVYTPGEVITGGAVLEDAGFVRWVGRSEARAAPEGAHVIDANGCILAPGFIDLQINGGFGHDFTGDPAALWRVAEKLPAYGVTAFLPTLVSSPMSRVALGQISVTRPRPAGFKGATPLGLHCEGPFLNPGKRGAHSLEHLLAPSPAAVVGWWPENGIRLVTLAPELPGALELIEALAGRGVAVGAGHSLATYGEALAGLAAGARYGTHLFNAMPEFRHREPGLAGALLTDGRSICGLIADGIHVHPAAVRLAWQALGSRRLNLVSDATAALGMPAGVYRLGDLEVAVGPDVATPDRAHQANRPGELEVSLEGRSCRLPDGALAGSAMSLDAALRNLIAMTGCSLAEALPTVTATPAAAIGLGGTRGQIRPGCHADMVLLSLDLHVMRTIVGGEVVFEAPGAFSD